MKSIKEIGDIRNKKILLRADLDVAVAENKIIETFRIDRQKETIDYLIKNGAKLVVIGHISDIDSFGPIVEQLSQSWGCRLEFLPKLTDIEYFLSNSQLNVAIVENIRRFDGEKENSDELARKLANGFDLYVNNNFAVCHRNHASVVAVTKFLPSYAGFLIKEETDHLQQVLVAPAEGKV